MSSQNESVTDRIDESIAGFPAKEKAADNQEVASGEGEV